MILESRPQENLFLRIAFGGVDSPMIGRPTNVTTGAVEAQAR